MTGPIAGIMSVEPQEAPVEPLPRVRSSIPCLDCDGRDYAVLPSGDRECLGCGSLVSLARARAALVSRTSPIKEKYDHTTTQLTPLRALLTEPVATVEWVLDGVLITGGVSVIAAKPKAGKSTLSDNLALMVARGAPFLGRSTQQGPVVHLALEEKREKIAEHYRRMGAANEPIFVHAAVAPQDGLAFLTNVIDRHRPTLAIIDPLHRLLRLKDWNDYALVGAGLEPLVRLARESGSHIMGTHHMGKLDREGADGLLGSTALFGAVDTALIYRRNAEGDRLLESIQRYGEDLPATVVKLDPQTGLLTMAGTASDLLEEKVIGRLLAVEDAPLTEKAVREQVPGNLTPKALRRLVKTGGMTRTGTGRARDPYLYAPVVGFSYQSYRSYLPVNTYDQPKGNGTAVTDGQDAHQRSHELFTHRGRSVPWWTRYDGEQVCGTCHPQQATLSTAATRQEETG